MYKIDCYGNKSNSCDFFHRELKAYQVDKASDSVTYIRFSTADNCAIQRVSKDGNITTMAWTYGAWANRTTLTYDTDLNTPLDAPAE